MMKSYLVIRPFLQLSLFRWYKQTYARLMFLNTEKRFVGCLDDSGSNFTILSTLGCTWSFGNFYHFTACFCKLITNYQHRPLPCPLMIHTLLRPANWTMNKTASGGRDSLSSSGFISTSAKNDTHSSNANPRCAGANNLWHHVVRLKLFGSCSTMTHHSSAPRCRPFDACLQQSERIHKKMR